MSGNFLFCSSFHDITVTASTQDSNYLSTNISNSYLQREWRNGSTLDSTVIVDLGSIKNISGIYIDGCNFSDLTLTRDTSTSFGASVSSTYTITQDAVTQRRRIYCPISTGIRAFKIIIPTQEPTDGLSIFRMGRVKVLSTSTITLSNDPQSYEYTAKDSIKTNQFLSGAYEDILLGSNLVWEGSFSWSARHNTYESELWAINGWNRNKDILFFENMDDFSRAYLCRKRNNITIELGEAAITKINVINLQEYI